MGTCSEKPREARPCKLRETWAKMTLEERKAIGAKLAEVRRKKRIEMGLPPVAPRKARLSPEELLAVQRASMARFWANHPEIRKRAAARRAALEELRRARAAERERKRAEREKGRQLARAAERERKRAEREETRRLAKLRKRAANSKAAQSERRQGKASNRKNTKPVVAISKTSGQRLRFPSQTEAAAYLFAQGKTESVVAARLIIGQVCNGHRRSGFGYYWEFPHPGRPMTLEGRKKRAKDAAKYGQTPIHIPTLHSPRDIFAG